MASTSRTTTTTSSSPDAKPGEEPALLSESVLSSSSSNDTIVGKSAEELVAEQRKWHEERIRRRLFSEYEKAGKALSDVVNDNLDTPLRLNSIRILGATSTRTGFLSSVASPYLSSNDTPKTSYLSSLLSAFSPYSQSPFSSEEATPTTSTLRDVLRKTRNITDDLNKFDIFSGVEAGLEASPSVWADEEDVDLVIKVKEASKYYVRTATDVGDGEGSATATARIRNAFGGAETLEGNASFGTRTKSAFQLRLSTPLFASPNTLLSLNGFATERDLSYFASCYERVRGGRLSIRHLTPYGEHEFAYDAALRNLGDIGPTGSMSIRNAAGPSVKSALSHTMVRDTRDDPFIATSGSYLRLMQEYAGLGGDVNFVKTEGETKISRALGEDSGFSMSWALRAGALLPLGEKAESHFLDRFHMGGPTSVRMFTMNGLGPKDANDHIGGDLHWSSGLSLLAPFPRLPEWPLKLHLFLNAGRLVPYTPSAPSSSSSLDSLSQNVTRNLRNALSEPSVSAGFGVVYRHSIVRLEANVGMPLVAHRGDGTRKGLQIGLGLHFL